MIVSTKKNYVILKITTAYCCQTVALRLFENLDKIAHHHVF